MNRVRIYLAGRVAFSLFFLLTSLYLLLAYLPFTYQQVVKGRLLPGLNLFADIHPFLSAGALALALLLLSADHDSNEKLRFASRRMRAAFLLVAAVLVGWLAGGKVLPNAQPGAVTYALSVLAVVPLIALGLLDWVDGAGSMSWSSGSRAEAGLHFRAAFMTAIFLTLVYSVASMVPRAGSAGPIDRVSNGLFAVGVSGVSHLVALSMLFATMNLLLVVSEWFPQPSITEFILFHCAAGVFLFLILCGMVFPSLGFEGARADLYAGAFAIAVVLYLSGLSIRVHARKGRVIASGFALALWAPASADAESQRSGSWKVWLSIVVLAFGAGAAEVATARTDWNYLLQKIEALVVAALAFRLFYIVSRRSREVPDRAAVLLLIAVGVLGVHRTLLATQNRVWAAIDERGTSAQFLQRYAGFDASYKVIADALAPPTGRADYYRFLTRNTNIPRSTRIAPVDINIAARLNDAAGPKPNIFVIVVDSLRRDYLAPYNRSVRFTPNIASFADGSVVMENAFTHYGGTGLAEPSIWVGGMLIHKQYVTPFAPMNTLQKLIETDRYRSFVSRDTILTTVVQSTARMTELDASRATMDYDLCASLSELEGRLASGGGPYFAYTQPQNIHISVINRAGAQPIDHEDYRGFYAPYASRLRRVDACFGGFIASLKKASIYDNSIVILTADHGDSLGEQGRWGHAYTIYPEVIRIPLLIHLPSALRSRLYVNTRAIAFSTDITPSLYYLLGHRPTARNPILGRPLFTERAAEQTPYLRESYLVASSYGAVYGILSGDGKGLFISDAVNYTDLWFDLTNENPVGSTLTSSSTLRFQDEIAEKIRDLDAFYGYHGSD